MSTESHDRAQTIARVALAVAMVGSLAAMFQAGRRQPSIVLIVLFTGWVASPFAGLALADARSMRWPPYVRHALQRLSVVVAGASLAVYGANAVTPLSAKGAFIFLVVPGVTWALSAIVLALAAKRSR